MVKSEQSIGRKGLALYRHKWHEDDKKAGGSSENAGDSRVATTEGKSNAFGWNDDAEFNAAPEPSFGRGNSQLSIQNNSIRGLTDKLSNSRRSQC